jgi:hypothetical protein
VGAVYNGEYKKAVIHVAIFGLMTTLMNTMPRAFHDFFELLRIVFIAYMAFDARRIAQERDRP